MVKPKEEKSKVKGDSSRGKQEVEFRKAISKSKVLSKIVLDCDELVGEKYISIKANEEFNHKGSKLVIDYKISSVEALREQARNTKPVDKRFYIESSAMISVCFILLILLGLAYYVGYQDATNTALDIVGNESYTKQYMYALINK